MELLQLKYFCDAAKTQNFSKTARNFMVAPSDISQSIKRLEKELSTSLFIRKANRIALSDAGDEFYKKVSVALEIIDDSMAELSDNAKSRIKICINTNRRIIMHTIEKFKKSYPNIDIEIKHFIEPISDNFDIIIANEDEKLKSYKRINLLSEKFALAVNSDNPLSAQEELNISEFSAEPFITMNEQNSLYALTNSICSDFGFKPHIAIKCDDPFYVRKCVEQNMGVAIVPLFSWKGQFSDNVILKPIDGYSRNTFAYIQDSKYIPTYVNIFIEMLLEECKDNG